jgi:membrane peptidoglycan carboxypeptidase
VAGKTGTSDDFRDSWFAGFDATHLAVVWVGYDDNRETKLTGSAGGLQVWDALMASLHPAPVTLTTPTGFDLQLIDYASGGLTQVGCGEPITVPIPYNARLPRRNPDAGPASWSASDNGSATEPRLRPRADTTSVSSSCLPVASGEQQTPYPRTPAPVPPSTQTRPPSQYPVPTQPTPQPVPQTPAPAQPQPSQPKPQSTVTLALQDEAQRAATAGDLPKAIQILERAIRIQPDSAQLWIELARCHLKEATPHKPNSSRARRCCSPAAATTSNNRRGW